MCCAVLTVGGPPSVLSRLSAGSTPRGHGEEGQASLFLPSGAQRLARGRARTARRERPCCCPLRVPHLSRSEIGFVLGFFLPVYATVTVFNPLIAQWTQRM